MKKIGSYSNKRQLFDALHDVNPNSVSAITIYTQSVYNKDAGGNTIQYAMYCTTGKPRKIGNSLRSAARYRGRGPLPGNDY